MVHSPEMCGICVVVHDRKPGDPVLVRHMCDRITHRGPDSAGYHVSGRVGLGMRRLRIIDLNTGDQPIFNEDRSLTIVFNGEIYNYRELRTRLLAKGHRFATASDTEVIVHLYEDMGAKAVTELSGMFALAIHDRESDRVFLARDRLGIKPLYYAETPDGLYAASEIKSLLAVPGIGRALDEVALDQYFSLLYIPAPRTIFREIRKLPPGHVLIKDPGRPAVVERYWQVKSEPQPARAEPELIEEFRARFDAAVASHLVADVPLGVFLSGGIDSGALVASMARAGATIRTLSLGFPPEYRDFDERRHAKLVAERYHTKHEEIVVEPKIHETVHTLARVFDEPMGDSGAVPNYLVCEGARRSVTVALSGLGGDELSAGYQRYLGMQLAEHYRKLPAAVRDGAVRRLVEAMPEPAKGGRVVDQAKRFVRHAALPWLERFYAFSSPMDRDRRAALYAPALRARVELDSALELMRRLASEQSSADPVNRMLCIDLQSYMVDDLLAVADRTSMAVSLEVRVPYLDHSLVEFMAGVPGNLKVRGMRKKHFLKMAFQHDLPKEILQRKKSGFSLPVARWLREDLRGLLEDTLSVSRLNRDGLFDAAVVADIKREHYTRRRDRSSTLWALLMFHLWADQYAR
jgi:asparagine synthase (glutamine-hydrolysing)